MPELNRVVVGGGSVAHDNNEPGQELDLTLIALATTFLSLLRTPIQYFVLYSTVLRSWPDCFFFTRTRFKVVQLSNLSGNFLAC
jgi:hypothetical protein